MNRSGHSIRHGGLSLKILKIPGRLIASAIDMFTIVVFRPLKRKKLPMRPCMFPLILMLVSIGCPGSTAAQELERPERSLRIATYNAALNRKTRGELSRELETGDSRQAKAIAEVIQIVRPDILLINEIDFDDGRSVQLLAEKYLSVGQNGHPPIEYRFHYTGPVNTGIDSGLDLNQDQETGGPDDALGFGLFPGQYGMAVYSHIPFDKAAVRSFQNFLWKDMPEAELPVDSETNQPYYTRDIMERFRLSSKSHWDIPFRIGDKKLHLLASHPTPPVFDGREDRNGCRNHDEIRLWSDYVSGKADYLYDDAGQRGGLSADSQFVILGDLNADPNDGDSRDGAIEQLLGNELVNNEFVPQSTGGAYWASQQGGANKKHKGEPLCDTGDFSDKSVGNMRIDYVLPSRTLHVVNSGVFWPKPNEAGAEAVQQSDHRLVWIDIEK